METKNSHDFITDGVLAYGVLVGRFVFEEERRIIFAVSDYPHIGASDAFLIYQISRKAYNHLEGLSIPRGIPDPPIPMSLINGYRARFLCGDSAHCRQNSFSLKDVDFELTEPF